MVGSVANSGRFTLDLFLGLGFRGCGGYRLRVG